MAFLGLCLALSGVHAPTFAASPPQSGGVRDKVPHDRQHKEEPEDEVADANDDDGAAPPVPEQAAKPPNVTLRAALAPGAAPLTEGLSWRMSKLGPNDEKELVWSGPGSEPKVYLRPGRYYVEANYGLAHNGQTIEVKKDKEVTSVLPLHAGTLLVTGAAVAGGPPLDDMFFVLNRTEPGKPPEEIGRSSLSHAVFHVPAGAYRLTARHGLASIEMPVSIGAGEESSRQAVLNSGRISLSAHAKENGPSVSGATFFVFQNGETGSQQEIVRSKLEEPKLSLPAGSYRVAAVLGLARVEQEIRVAPGDDQDHDLVLNAGGVRLASILAGHDKPLDRHLLYRIYSLSPKEGAPNQELFTSTIASPTIFLPSGRYRIESQYGWHNARQTREIEVGAGDLFDVNFEHKASEVKLKLVQSPGAEPIDPVKWTLKYNGGGTVLISQDAAPTLILQAGSYQAMAQHESKTYSQTFEAASNKEQTIELLAR